MGARAGKRYAGTISPVPSVGAVRVEDPAVSGEPPLPGRRYAALSMCCTDLLKPQTRNQMLVFPF